jgi:hypothetical protein
MVVQLARGMRPPRPRSQCSQHSQANARALRGSYANAPVVSEGLHRYHCNIHNLKALQRLRQKVRDNFKAVNLAITSQLRKFVSP